MTEIPPPESAPPAGNSPSAGAEGHWAAGRAASAAAPREGSDAGRKASGMGPSIVGVAVVAAILAGGLVARPVAVPGGVELSLFGVHLPAVCWLRTTTGLPCASCGLTRSIVLLLHGRLSESLAMHPFGIPTLALALLLLPPRVAVLAGRPGRWIARWDRLWLIATVSTLVLMVLWWAVRAVPIVLGYAGRMLGA